MRGVLFSAEKKRKKKKKWGRGGQLTCYNLNISDEFTNKY
jgi:hypothetical protein